MMKMMQGSALPNETQRERWNQETGTRWLERHAMINEQIAPFGHRAMERGGIRPGERLLDVGCGCGETTAELASRVGPTGAVVGIDISAPLIRFARTLVKEAGPSNLRFEQADAQTYRFPAGSFDLVFSRFGVMFFDDPEAAFRNLHSSLAPGGRVAFVCWPAPQENLFVTIPLAAAVRHVAPPTPPEPGAPGPFAFADPDRVRAIMSRAQFADIVIERIVERVGGKSIDGTAEMLLQIGPLDEALRDLDDGTKQAIRADICDALVPFAHSGRVVLDAVAWLVTARPRRWMKLT